MSFFEDFKNLNKYFNERDYSDQVTFYSETSNDWQHLSGIVKELINKTNFKILYVCSDKNDYGLNFKERNFNSYLINNKYLLTWLFKNIKSKVMLMTLPDLNQYYLKRSKYLVHYIYIPHSLSSLHSIYRKGAFDYFDTLFCVGPHHVEEAKKIEEIYKLKKKILIEFGYCKIDSLINCYKNFKKNEDNKITFLIAPTWGDSCIINSGKVIKVMDHIKSLGHNIILRPHPITVRESNDIINKIISRYENYPNFIYQPSTDNNQTLFESDVLISDWSGVAFEFAFGLKKPVLFVDTSRKIKNIDFNKIGIESFEFYAREMVGEFFDTNKIYTLNNINTVNENQIKKSIFSLGKSADVACEYISKLMK
jgi:YidC/Oxa1 family membrane protein insertase